MEYHKAIKIRLIEDNEMLYRKYNKRSKSRIKIISIAIPIWFKAWKKVQAVIEPNGWGDKL